MLATYWWLNPYPDPIGEISLWALAAAVAYGLVVRVTRWRVLLFAAPLLFGLSAVLLELNQPSGGMWADQQIGYYILSLATILFALEVARSGSRTALVYGGVVLFLFGGLLTLEAVGRSSELMRATRDLPARWIVLAGLLLWLVLFTLLMRHAAHIARQRRERAKGRCTTCDYDLTGNVSGRCPECGTSVGARAD